MKKTLENFLSVMKERNIEPKSVEIRWPYAHCTDFQAFEVDHGGDVFYFLFDDKNELFLKTVRN